MKKDVYNVGIVGATADIANAHIDAIINNSQFCLKAVCDLNKKKLLDTYEAFENIIITTDYKSILDNSDIDIIVICTPNHLHSSISIEALKANKNVLCEKPMTINIQQGTDILNATKNSQGIFVISYHFAFFPEVQYFKDHLNNYGKIKHFKFESSEHLFPGKEWNFEKYNGGVWLDWAPNALSVLRQILPVNDNLCNFEIIDAKLSSINNLKIETNVKVNLKLDNIEGELLIDWEANENEFVAQTTFWDDKGTEINLNHTNNSILINNVQIWKGVDLRYRSVYKDFIKRIESKSSNINSGILDSRIIDAVFKL